MTLNENILIKDRFLNQTLTNVFIKLYENVGLNMTQLTRVTNLRYSHIIELRKRLVNEEYATANKEGRNTTIMLTRKGTQVAKAIMEFEETLNAQ